MHVIEGQGGNIAVIEGRNGLTVVDTQFANLYPDIKKAIGKISTKPVRYIINTHGHNDHTNGNASFSPDYQPLIIAHHNTAALMTAYNQTAETPNALPQLTFGQTLTLHGREPLHLVSRTATPTATLSCICPNPT